MSGAVQMLSEMYIMAMKCLDLVRKKMRMVQRKTTDY